MKKYHDGWNDLVNCPVWESRYAVDDETNVIQGILTNTPFGKMLIFVEHLNHTLDDFKDKKVWKGYENYMNKMLDNGRCDVSECHEFGIDLVVTPFDYSNWEQEQGR